jgi:hypothetical protein
VEFTVGNKLSPSVTATPPGDHTPPDVRHDLACEKRSKINGNWAIPRLSFDKGGKLEAFVSGCILWRYQALQVNSRFENSKGRTEGEVPQFQMKVLCCVAWAWGGESVVYWYSIQ